MSIKALIELAPPPASPTGTVGEHWPWLERRLSLRLPTDYKNLIDLYGVGDFAGFITIFSPLCKIPHLNLINHSRNTTRYEREFTENEDEYPFVFYPDAGGLLPFGATELWDTLFWRTSGAPEGWPIVVQENKSTNYEEIEASTTDFIAGVISGVRVPKMFGSDGIEIDKGFRAFQEKLD